MTTDITELAQSLKNAASKALIEEGLTWFSEEQLSHEDGIALHKADAEFIALANPANVLALVEALEEAQETIAFQQGDIKALLSSLESRTVKLPQRHSMLLREDFNEDYHTEMAFKADEVQASLAAAGIKVEAE